ncbi:MAG TPA: ion channel [Bdellovibrionota bacterium]|nr:ion channel [Bdellovibrionota bacterium]
MDQKPLTLNFKIQIKNLFRAMFNPFFLFIFLIANITFFSLTTGLYLVEKGENPAIKSIFDAFYWGVSTMTTVGYGDVVPVTTEGRFFALALMLSGTFLFITFTGVLVSLWMGREVEEELVPLEQEVIEEESISADIQDRLDDIIVRLDRLEKQLRK